MNVIETGAVLYDRRHWGRMMVGDRDRLQFLHNQSSNDLKSCQPGTGCDTVFLTSTARTIDLATAYILEDSVLLLVSPDRVSDLISFLDRYIFFADQVTLTDISAQTTTLSLLGPQSHQVLETLGAGAIVGQPHGNHHLFQWANQEVRVAVGSELGREGYTLIAQVDQTDALIDTLIQAGATQIDDRAWEELRIQQGRPMPGHELTEDYNPLEAGLWRMVSFSKGCYIGQETIARLDTYKGVKQQLWGVKLDQFVEPGAAVLLEGEKVGVLTSAIATEAGAIGLAYIRTKAGGAGLRVTIGPAAGEIVDLPFATRAPVSQT